MKPDPQTQPDIVVGPREHLFHLLAEAAEIEHSLMCAYLFAAFSLRTGPDSGLHGAEADAVERWRRAIVSVAIDEMVHLLLVANLSIALGGRPWFGRPNFPVPPGYFPSGVCVRLTPFDRETLDHFIFLERPDGEAVADGAGFEHDTPYNREEAYHGLMPSVQDYLTVGRLYEALRVNLVEAVRRLGEDAVFVGPVAGQIGPDAVDLAGVATIGGLSDALAAIALIVEQGEGSAGDRADSHYRRFRTIRDEHEALLAANPDFRPAWPVGENPVMRRPPEPEGKLFVDDPAAARVLDFANAAYGLLLRCLVQAFGRQGDDARAAQARHLDLAIGLMHLMGRAASALATMPASASVPGATAGMTFTMLRGVEPIFAGPAEEQLLRERLRELFGGACVAERACERLAGAGAMVEALEDAFRNPA